jgi:hypothetical protein
MATFSCWTLSIFHLVMATGGLPAEPYGALQRGESERSPGMRSRATLRRCRAQRVQYRRAQAPAASPPPTRAAAGPFDFTLLNTGMVFITKTPLLLLQICVIGGMPWLEVRRRGAHSRASRASRAVRPAAAAAASPHLIATPRTRTRSAP